MIMIFFSGIYSKFVSYFEEKGFKAHDIPKAIVIHGLLDVFILAFTWSSCYILAPSQMPLLKGPINKAISFLPDSFTRTASNTPFLSSRLGTAYIEASCLRKLIRPVAFPAKLYFTYQLVKVLPGLSVDSIFASGKDRRMSVPTTVIGQACLI